VHSHHLPALRCARARLLGALITAVTAAAAAVPAAEAAVPTPHPSWRGDFSTGDWTQYDDCRSSHMDGIFPADYAIDTAFGRLGSFCPWLGYPALVHDIWPPPGFGYAGRYTVRARDASYRGEAGERSLDTLWPGDGNGWDGKTRAYQGADTWYRDDFYLPAGSQPTRNTDWNWIYELHNYPDDDGDANVALGIVMDNSDCFRCASNLGRLSLDIRGGGALYYPVRGVRSANPTVSEHWIVGPAFRTGHWYDMVLHIHWDWRSFRAGGRGYVQYWLDGRNIGYYIGPNLYWVGTGSTGEPTGVSQAYLQHGYYRPTDAGAGYAQPTIRIYHGATMLGPTAASIGENLP
jgi:Polysaccharide lyase